MLWDKLAVFYDAFENIYNGEVNRALAVAIAEYIDENDSVLECACGTGMFSEAIAKKCKYLYATDYSTGMLRRAKQKLGSYPNVKLARADITNIRCNDYRFDKVVAANVIHLLDEPEKALNELLRVCRNGGKVIIPTYINAEKKEAGLAAKMLGKIGVDFKRQFDLEAYKKFFEELGHGDAEYKVIEGRMPSAIAILRK